MARPKDYTLATLPAADDRLLIDGATNGTRSLDAGLYSRMASARAARQGLVFDGSTSAVATVANVPAFGTSAWTVSFWVNLNSLRDYNGLFGGASGALTAYTDSTGTLVVGKSGVGSIYVGSYFPSALKTYLVTITNDGTTATIYRDGVSITTSTSANIIANYTAGIVAFGSNNNASANPLSGSLSGALIYNRALTAAEVVALYEAGVPAGSDYNNASNTSIISGNDSTFTGGLGSWVAFGTGTSLSNPGGTLRATGNSTANAIGASLNAGLIPGKRYRVTLTVSASDAQTLTIGGATQAITSTPTTYTVQYTQIAGHGSNLYVYFDNPDTTLRQLDVDNITVYPLGLLLAPDAAQAGGGLVWYDTSGNAANISWTSGVSWNVPSSRYLGGNWTTSGNLTVSGGKASLTSAGNQTLEVISSSGAAQAIAFFSGSGGGSGIIAHNSSQSLRIGRASDSALTGYTDELFIAASSGNLLVGTTTDGGQKLQVNGTAYVSGDATFAGQLNILSANSYLKSDASNLVYETYAGKGHQFKTGGTTALTLDSSQNATFAGKVTTTQVTTASGTTASTATGTAVTLFTLSGTQGLFIVHAYLGVDDASNYAAFATVVMDGTAARIVSNNATLMSITLSGSSVQATQGSGTSQTIKWKYTRM